MRTRTQNLPMGKHYVQTLNTTLDAAVSYAEEVEMSKINGVVLQEMRGMDSPGTYKGPT